MLESGPINHCGFTSRTAHTSANHKLVEAYSLSTFPVQGPGTMPGAAP